MRRTPLLGAEKFEIIPTLESSSLGISRTLWQLALPKSISCHLYMHYLTGSMEVLAD